ncbi:uncharacterized protein TNCV_3021121 [Trichonephila clavipes]|nr:uncharacterized protein TNCV_3021121 [Trichonephila clavipes]
MPDFVDEFFLSALRFIWIQHDCDPGHLTAGVRRILKDCFDQQITGYGGSVERPPQIFGLMGHYMRSAVKRISAVASLVLRASDSRPEGLCSMPMPPNSLRVHTENVLVKSVGPKVLWVESRVQGTGEYFPSIQFHGKIVEVEIGGSAIYCPFGEFFRAKSYCHLYGAQGLGQHDRHNSSPLPRGILWVSF